MGPTVRDSRANSPGYPQQQPGYPPQGYQHFPMQTPPPSGATGITAAALAGLGALANLGSGFLGLLGLIGLSVLSTDAAYQGATTPTGGAFALLIFVVVLAVVAGALLAGGAVTLLQRKMIGRWLVVGGCAVTLLGGLLSFVIAAAVSGPYSSFGGGWFSIPGLMFPIATIVLVLLPSTTAWLRAKHNPAGPY